MDLSGEVRHVSDEILGRIPSRAYPSTLRLLSQAEPVAWGLFTGRCGRPTPVLVREVRGLPGRLGLEPPRFSAPCAEHL